MINDFMHLLFISYLSRDRVNLKKTSYLHRFTSLPEGTEMIDFVKLVARTFMKVLLSIERTLFGNPSHILTHLYCLKIKVRDAFVCQMHYFFTVT